MEPKTIGIVGITAEGASLCYRTIVAESPLTGGAHPPIAMYTGSFAVLNARLKERDWPEVGALIGDSIARLVSSGAELVIMPANATHYATDYFLPQCPVPFLSIVDVSADACAEQEYTRVAVLGIGLTMTDGLYEQPLRSRGIEPMTPTADEQATLNQIIYEEIIPARVTPTTGPRIVEILAALRERGAEAAILACTELPLVITEENTPLPFIDTTRLLARTALAHAITTPS
ncbi:MAG TPA: amino acid racemase [Ktedonobacterales bacterium]|jgi:aspartate racemase